MLGSNFFQDMTGLKREKGLKTYDHQTFVTDEYSDTESEADTFWTMEESGLDEQTLEVLASEDDEDATLILQFEDAVSELVQNELGALFSTYQDARKRLSEKVRFRGFWSVKKGDRSSKAKGMKGKGKGKLNWQSLAICIFLLPIVSKEGTLEE